MESMFSWCEIKIYKKEYNDNNEAIFLSSLGAPIQNIKHGVTAAGLSSAWISGAGDEITNE